MGYTWVNGVSWSAIWENLIWKEYVCNYHILPHLGRISEVSFLFWSLHDVFPNFEWNSGPCANLFAT